VTKRSFKEFPLARYAGQYWADHAEIGDVSKRTEDMIQYLFNPEDHHSLSWVWIYDTILSRSDDSEGPSRPGWSPLHLAAQHGFYRGVEWLITACSQDVNVSGDYLRTPLHIASEYGLFKVV
jgi:ankyrin repeat protein